MGLCVFCFRVFIFFIVGKYGLGVVEEVIGVGCGGFVLVVVVLVVFLVG